MGSYRTLRRRRQRQHRKAHPYAGLGPGFITPTWVARDVAEMWTKSLKMLDVITKKY